MTLSVTSSAEDPPPRVRIVADVTPYLAAIGRAIESTLREVAREDEADGA